jgi:hypothetical protein
MTTPTITVNPSHPPHRLRKRRQANVRERCRAIRISQTSVSVNPRSGCQWICITILRQGMTRWRQK